MKEKNEAAAALARHRWKEWKKDKTPEEISAYFASISHARKKKKKGEENT